MNGMPLREMDKIIVCTAIIMINRKHQGEQSEFPFLLSQVPKRKSLMVCQLRKSHGGFKTNPSAHSYGNIHYDLARKRAVESQCFAAIIVQKYIDKHTVDNETAIDSLKFNRELLDKVSETMSTCMTKE